MFDVVVGQVDGISLRLHLGHVDHTLKDGSDRQFKRQEYSNTYEARNSKKD